MKITVLKEGNFSVDDKDNFEPLVKGVKMKGLRMAVQPFLIETEHDLILIDAGLGWKEDGERVVKQKMEEAGYDLWDVSKVLISHLHNDHIEGLLDDDGEILFPDADIYIQERDFQLVLSGEEKGAYNLELLKRLEAKAGIIWLNDDYGYISPEIQYEVTGGHTPFHQVFWINEGGETVFYGGDDLPHSSYLAMPIAYRIDFNGRKSMELRKKWELQAKAENWKILLYHDMRNTILELD